MNHVAEIAKEWGHWFYGLIFLWTFIEGETFVILSGMAAKKGYLDIRLLILCAWLGSFFGDQLYFLVGRVFGKRIASRFPRLQQKMATATCYIERHSTIFLLSYRFIYGIRNVASLAVAMSDVTWRRFAALNFIAAGVWAVVFAGGGYLAGGAMRRLFGPEGENVSYAILGVFVTAVLFLVHHNLRNGPAEQKEILPNPSCDQQDSM